MPTSDMQIFEKLLRNSHRNDACALVILIRTEGSVPAKPGAKMLVSADGETEGTIGGGAMEYEITETARQAIGEGGPRTVQVDLTEAAGYACGGRAVFYIEPVIPAPRLLIAGAGHIGRALCPLSSAAGFSVTIADDREEFADPEHFPDADRRVVIQFKDLFSQITVTENTYIVCATRGHAHDYDVVRQALKTPAPYIGLLGSRRKRGTFIENLRADGISTDALARLHTPVGLDIGAVTPQEIAISIIAELILERRKHVHQSGSDSSGGRGLPAYGKDQTTASGFR